MLAILILASPDRGIAWLIYALLAFLLISIVVGAMAGPKVFRAGAPGALPERDRDEPAAQASHPELRPGK